MDHFWQLNLLDSRLELIKCHGMVKNMLYEKNYYNALRVLEESKKISQFYNKGMSSSRMSKSGNLCIQDSDINALELCIDVISVQFHL